MSKKLDGQNKGNESKLSAHEQNRLLPSGNENNDEQNLYEDPSDESRREFSGISITNIRAFLAQDPDNCCSRCHVLLDQGTGEHVIEVDDPKQPGQKKISGVYCSKCYYRLVGSGLYNIITGKTPPADVLDWHLQKTAEEQPAEKLHAALRAIRSAVLEKISTLTGVLKKALKK